MVTGGFFDSRIATTLVSEGDAHSGFRDEKGLIPVSFNNTGQGWWNEGNVAGTVRTPDGSDSLKSTVVAFALQGAGKTSQNSQGSTIKEECSFTLNTTDTHGIAAGMQVRRLTPKECERLQGVPDDHTLVIYNGKLMADGPRYKMIGNGFAVPCVRWIGERIAMVDALKR